MAPRLGVTTRVMVDGRQLDDGCLDWSGPAYEYPRLGRGLIGDDGLSVVWGRRTTVDQPSPSTCAFTVTDDGSGTAYFDAFSLGATVEVFAEGDGTATGAVQAFADGGFETGVNGWGTTSNAVVTRSTVRPHAGAAAAAVTATDGALPLTVILAPAPVESVGGNPGAWDAIPTTRGGTVWPVSAWVWVPPAVTVAVDPVLFSGPFQSSASVAAGAGAVVPAGSTARWVLVAFEFAPGVNDRWVGVAVTVTGGGLPWDGVDPALTWDAVDPTLAWDEFGTVYVDEVSVMAPTGSAPVSVLVFSGRITDLESAFDDDAGAPVLGITASDFLAELGNRYIGSEPFLVEPAGARITRILGLAAAGHAPITADVADTLEPVPVGWVDIDRQPAAAVLTDTVVSVDGVLWPATHISTGPYVRVEDTSARLAQSALILSGGVIIIGPALFPPDADPAPWPVSACDVMRDPVRFTLEAADIATRVTVTWEEQTTDDDGNPAPTSRTVEVTDPAREAVAGSRGASVQTILTTATMATTVAERFLARLTGLWRIEGVRLADDDIPEPDDDAAALFLALLDGVERGGLPLILTDMPAWSPLGDTVPAYLEGGEYRYRGGGWDLSLVVSRANGIGTSAAWDELDPTWAWDQFDPNITWDDLRGVGA